MKRTAIRKQLIFKFLDTKYPNAFVKKTIFGNLTTYGDEWVVGVNVCSGLCKWFSISNETAMHYLKEWEHTLPVVVSIRNSTNHTVLIGETLVVNPTQ
jgi:hypothetical protein